MVNKILIIGVGSAGVKVADKMNLPNSKKIFVGSRYFTFDKVKSEGEKLSLVCKERPDCPMLSCHCYKRPVFCKKTAKDYEDEIRECIIRALE